jgi:hypothetical protein
MRQRVKEKKFTFLTLMGILCLIFIFSGQVFSQNNDKPKVVITPGEATVELGSSLQFSAYLKYKDGRTESADFLWSIAGKPVGTITGGGLFTAIAYGKAQVVASVGKLKARARVTVPGDSLGGLHVVIVPHDALLIEGETLQYTAHLEDSTGPVLPETEFVWSVLDPAVASIDSSGFLTALTRGNTFVNAHGGGFWGKAHLSVKVDTTGFKGDGKNKVWITPRDTTVNCEDEVRFEALFVDERGYQVDTTFTWTVDEGGFGEIDAETGLFTAVTRGHGFVHASVGELSGKAHVTVLGNHWKLVIFPRDTAIVIDESVQMTAFFRDTAGVLVEAECTWGVADTDVISIDSSGVVVGLLKGSTFVYATDGNLIGKSHISVHDSLEYAEEDEYLLVILPGDSTVAVGDSIQYQAFLVDSLDNWTEAAATWRIPGKSTGSLSEDGLFVAEFPGRSNIQAKAGGYAAIVKVFVEWSDPVLESSGADNAENILDNHIPDKFCVYDNFPNPYNPDTTIRYDLPLAVQVTMRIYDQLGRQVKVLVNTFQDAGSHEAVWDSRDRLGNSLPTGFYFLRIEAGDFTATRKMLLMK